MLSWKIFRVQLAKILCVLNKIDIIDKIERICQSLRNLPFKKG